VGTVKNDGNTTGIGKNSAITARMIILC